MAEKRRIDQLLVAHGHFDSRARAQAAIAAGLVRADGAVVKRPSDRIADDARIEAEAAHPWASRGGIKLAHALDHFAIDVVGRTCIDVGSSTGGFTDVLLTRGATRVVAIDTGRDQMLARLRSDPRVDLHEATDARAFARSYAGERASLIAVDVSFISIALILPEIEKLAAPQSELVALIKPQFEVGRERIGKKGIVTDEAARREAIDRIVRIAEALGWRVAGVIDSPIEGGDGNREYLLHARR